MMKKRWLAISLLAVLGVLGLCFGCATDVVQETRTVTFMCRGEVYDTQEVLVGEKFTFPTAPESYQLDDDYQNVFLNWTTDPNPNEYRTEGVVAEPEYVYDNLTLYAMFGRRPIDSGDGDSSNVTYRVEFRMPRGEDFGDYSGELIWEDPEGVKRHDDAKLPADNLMPEIEGYHFTGKWEGASLSDVRGNRRVTAVYEKNVYDLVWHYLDETETFRTEFRGEVNLGEKPSVDPAFLFEGWYLDDGFQTEATLDEMPAGNVDLYAKYSIDFSVVTVSQEGTMVYGDADNQFYISGLKDAEGLSYTFAWTVDGKTGEKTASRTYPVKNAGAYHVAVHVFADYKDGLLLDEGDALSGNSGSPTMFEIILEKAELSATVTLSANRVVYGDPAPKANATYAGFVFDEDAESVGVGEDFVIMQENEEKSGALHVGNYTVETRPHVLANYKFAPIDPLPFEVTKRALSVSFDVDDYGYGDLFTPQVSFTDFMYEDGPQSLGEHWFTLDGDGRYLGNGTERFSAGEHSAQLFGYASDDYEVALPAAVSFSVAKRAAYATVSAEGGIYGCTPEVSYTFENVLEDDKANFVPTYTYRRGTGIYSAPHFVVGSYTVGASFEERGSANYLPVVVTDAAFEITKKPLAVSVSANETYIYGDPIESTLSVVFEDAFVFGEDENTPNLVKKEVRYRYTADGTDYVSSVFKVNEYSVRAFNIEADNYEFSFPETSFEVLKKALTLTVRLQENSILYGTTPAPVKDNGADLFNGIEYDGFIAGEGARFVFGNALPVIAYRTAAGAEADTFHAGEYIATTSADPENYRVTVVDAPFTVRPRTLYVDIRLEDGALTYGEKPTASIVYQKDGYDGFFANEQDTLAADAYLEYAGDTVYTTSQLAAIATKMVAGTYAVSVKGIGELADYTVTYREDVSCTVSPKHLTVTLTAGQTKYTYGDTPAVDITFSPFAYDEDESLFGANASALKYRKDGGKDVYTPATYFGAGAYQVTLEGLVNANYEVEVKDASFDVEKKALTVTVGAQGFTYGDRATPVPTLTYDGFVPEESETVLGGSPVYAYAQAEKAYGKDFFDAGSYTVSVTGYSSDNYAITYRGGSFNVAKRTASATVTATGGTYGDTPVFGHTQTNIIERDSAGFAFAYKITFTRQSNGSYADYTKSGTYDPAGYYRVTLTYTPNANYNFSVNTAPFTIARKALTVGVSGVAGPYTYGTVPAPKLLFEGFVPEEDASVLSGKPASEFTYYTEGSATTSERRFPVGTWYVAATQGYTSQNYTISYAEKTQFVVSKARLTVTVTADDIIYGQQPRYSAETVGFVYDQTVTNLRGSLTYTVGGEKSAAGFYRAGRHTVSASGYSSNNYDFDYVQGTFTVKKAALTVSVTVPDITYGELPAPALSYNGFVSRESASVLSGVPEYTYGGATNAKGYYRVGDHDVSVKGYSSDDYEITYTPSSFHVSPKAITVSVTEEGNFANRTYDSAYALLLASTVNGLVDGDTAELLGTLVCTLNGTRLGDVAADGVLHADSYTFSAGGYTSADYTISYIYGSDGREAVSFTVSPSRVTLTLKDGWTVYGNDTAEPWYTTAGNIYREELTFTVSLQKDAKPYTAGSEHHFSVGRYTVTVSHNDNPDYTVSGTPTRTFTVSPRTVTLAVSVDSGEYTYGDTVEISDGIPTSSESILPEDADAVSLRRTVKRNGEAFEENSAPFFPYGTYTVTAEHAANANYTFIGKNTASFTVKKRTFTISYSATGSRLGEHSSSPTFAEGEPFTFHGTLVLNTNEAGDFSATSEDEFKEHYSWRDGKNGAFYITALFNGAAVDVTENFNVGYSISVILDSSQFNIQIVGTQKFTYDGKDHDIHVEATAAEAVEVRPVIKYSLDKGGNYTEEIPVKFRDAGSYTVYYTVEAENFETSTGEYTVTVDKAAYTVTEPTKDFTYNGTAQGGDVTVKGVNGDTSFKGEVQYDGAHTFTDHKEGGYTVTYSVSGDNNYNNIEGATYTVNINKAAAKIDASALEEQLVGLFDKGDSYTATFNGSVFEVDWSLAKPADTFNGVITAVSVSDSSEIRNAATYTVTLTIGETNNYTGDEKTVTVIIGKAEYQVTEPTKNFTYNGTAQGDEVTVKGVEGDKTFQGKVTYKDDHTFTNANTYPVTYSISGDNNYNDKAGSYTVKIDKATPKLVETVDSGEYVYNTKNRLVQDTVYNAVVKAGSGIYSDAVVSYKVNGGNFSSALEEIVNAGSYTVTVQVSGDNYNTVTAKYTLTVAKANYTVTEPTEEFTYNGKAQGGEVTVSGVEGDESFKGEVRYAGAHTFTDYQEGGYTVTYTVSGDDNYNDVTDEYTVIIKKAKVVIETDHADLTADNVYTGEALYTVSAHNAKAHLENAADVFVSVDHSVTFEKPTGGEGTPFLQDSFVNAGTYTITLTVTADNNYDAATKVVKVIINRADYIVTADDQTYTYDGTAQGAAIQVETVREGDEYSVTYGDDSSSVKQITNVKESGSFTYTVSGNANYKDATGSYKITINPAKGTLTRGTDLEVLTYTAGEQTVDLNSHYTLDGDGHVSFKKTGDSGSFDGGVFKFTNVKDGNGVIFTVTAVDGENYIYEGLSVTFTLTVNKAEVSLPTVSGSVYSGSVQTASVEESPRYEVIENNGGTNAGSYPVKISLTDSENYKWNTTDDASVTLTFEIVRKEIALKKSGDPEALTYTGKEQEVDFAEYITNEGDGIVSYSKEGGSRELDGSKLTFVNVADGNVTVTVTVEDKADGNYTYSGKFVTLTLTVNKADYIVTADDQTYTYDGTAQGAAIQVKTVHEGDEHTVTYDGEDSVKQITNVADSCSVTYKVDGNDNYNETSGSYTITIDKKAVSITVPTEGITVTYDGRPHGDEKKILLVLDEEEGGIPYSAEDENWQDFLAGGSIKFDSKKGSGSNVPMFIDATGSETVTVTIVPSNNYSINNATDNGNFSGGYTVAIAKAKAAIDVSELNFGDLKGEGTKYSATYRGTPYPVDWDKAKPADTFNGTLTEEIQITGAVVIENANTYTVTLSLAGNDNYEGDTKIFTITINKAQAVIDTSGINFGDLKGEGTKYSATYRGTPYPVDWDKATTNFGTVTYDEKEIKNAGTYTVTLSVADTENYDGDTKEFTITIAKAQLEKPTADPTPFTYNKSAQTYTLGGFDGTTMKIEGAERTQTNAGDYQFTVSLSDNMNYEWTDSTQEDLSFTFTIAKAKVEKLPDGVSVPSIGGQVNWFGKTLSDIGLGANWYWGAPDDELTLGEHTYGVIYNEDPANYEDYTTTVTFKTERTQLKLTFSQAVKDGGIEVDYGAWQVQTAEEFAGSYTLVGVNRSNADIKALAEEMEYFYYLWKGGPFSLNTPFADGKIYGGTYLLLYRFSLDEENPYYEWVADQDPTELDNALMLKIKSVEYAGALYTIEDALHEATGGTVTVKYNTAFAYPEVREEFGVYRDDSYYTVKNGVTLKLPYDGTNTYGSPGANSAGTSVLSFGDSSKQQLLLSVPANVTVINRGKIEVGGYVTGSGGGNLAGQTNENYARVDLGEKAKIESYGDIDVYGFITESTWNNGSEVIMHGGSMKMPFVVVEHRGGSAFSNFKNDLSGSPFNRFFLHNVSAKLTFESDSNLYGDAKLKTDKKEFIPAQENQTNIHLIGTDAKALIQLVSGSKVVAKLQAQAFEKAYAQSPIKLEVYGDMTLHALSLKVTVTIITVDVTTAGVLFPLSWYWQVTLNPLTEGGTATVNATEQDFKLLPGAKLTIEKGVTLKAKRVAVYKANSWTDAGVGTSNKYETNKGDGILTVNGALSVDEFGGEVQSGADDAILQVNSKATILSKELKTSTGNALKDGSLTWDDINLSLGFTSGTADGVGTYVCTNGTWAKTDKTQQSFTYTVNYHQNYDSDATEGKTGTVQYVNTDAWEITELDFELTRDFYRFTGWYMEPECETPFESWTATPDAVLDVYAGWEKIDYIINYHISGAGSELVNSNASAWRIDEDVTLQPASSRGENGELTFGGWFFDAGYTQSATVIDTAAIGEHGHTNRFGEYIIDVYAYFSDLNVEYEISYNLALPTGYEDISFTAPAGLKIKIGQTLTAEMLPVDETLTKHDTDYTKQYYFDGWLANGKKVQVGAEISGADIVDGKVALTANWAEKVKLTVTLTAQGTGGWLFGGGSSKTASCEVKIDGAQVATPEVIGPGAGRGDSNTPAAVTQSFVYYLKPGQGFEIVSVRGKGTLFGDAKSDAVEAGKDITVTVENK